MKSFFFILTLLFIYSCSSGDDLMTVVDNTTPPVNDMSSDPSGDDDDLTDMLMGDFISVAHETLGKASVNNEQSKLDLTDFKSDSGPLLELYLATDENASSFISLGELKGLEGNFSYDIPEEANLETHKYVIVWCVDFSVNFGYAILE